MTTTYRSPSLDRREQKRRLRAVGWITCPLCGGFGIIANRYTYAINTCGLCKGQEMIDPQRIDKSKA